MTKTKSQKARAKAAKQGAGHGKGGGARRAQPPRGEGRNKNKKWYVGIDTQWGSLGAGSGDSPGKKGRNIGGMAGSTEYNSAPVVRNNIIINDELVAQVNGSETFDCVPYAVQPGDPRTFPWLSKLALLYQKYKFRKLCFYYKPLVGVFANSGVKGKVALAADMDAAGETLVNIQQAEGYEPHVDALLTQNSCLEMDPRILAVKPVRGQVLPPGANANVYDVAKLFVCAYATADSSVIGELHVKYEVELLCPMLPQTTALTTNNKLFDATLNSATVTNNTPTITALSNVRLNGIQAVNNAGVITLQPGLYAYTYSIVMSNSGAGVTAVSCAMTVTGGLPVQPSWIEQMPAKQITAAALHGVLRVSAPTDVSFSRTVTFASGTTTVTDYATFVAL